MATTTSFRAPSRGSSPRSPAAGTLVLATQVPAVAHWTIKDALSWLMLAVLIAVLEQFPIHVRFKTETFNMSMTDAAWTAGLLIVSPSVLLFAVAAGGIAGQLLRRRQLHKAAFNVGQYIWRSGAGRARLHGLRVAGRRPRPRGGWWPWPPWRSASW